MLLQQMIWPVHHWWKSLGVYTCVTSMSRVHSVCVTTCVTRNHRYHIKMSDTAFHCLMHFLQVSFFHIATTINMLL